MTKYICYECDEAQPCYFENIAGGNIKPTECPYAENETILANWKNKKDIGNFKTTNMRLGSWVSKDKGE